VLFRSGFNITNGSVWVGDELVIGNNDPDKHRYVARYLPSSGTLEVASMDSNGDWWKRMEMRGRGKGSRIEFFNDLYNVSVYESSNSNAPNVREIGRASCREKGKNTSRATAVEK